MHGMHPAVAAAGNTTLASESLNPPAMAFWSIGVLPHVPQVAPFQHQETRMHLQLLCSTVLCTTAVLNSYGATEAGKAT